MTKASTTLIALFFLVVVIAFSYFFYKAMPDETRKFINFFIINPLLVPIILFVLIVMIVAVIKTRMLSS